jgi:hypothetical protein
MPARTLSLKKRITVLERLQLTRRSSGVNVTAKIKMLDREKQILNEAIQRGFSVISQEEADRLDLAIAGLPVANRTRVHQLLKEPLIVVISGADANL